MTEETFLFGPRQRADRAYWQGRPAAVGDPGTLPTDRKRSAVPLLAQRSLLFELPAGVAEKVTRLAKGSPLLVLATVAAGVVGCLRRYGAAGTVAFGTATHGADSPQLLPIGIGPTEGLSFRTLLTVVRGRLSEAYGHQDVPLDRVAPASDGVAAAPFHVRIDVDGHGDEVGPAGNDVSLLVRSGPDGMVLTFTYHHRLFGEATVRRFAGHLVRVLQQGLADLDRPVASFELLSDSERAELRAATCPRPVAEDATTTVHSLVAGQAEHTPDAVALVQGDRSVDYRQLMSAAGAVAARLAGDGVGTGDVVAVCADRSMEAVTAIAGVLLAGAAYLPLNPALPPERQRSMIRVTGARHVLLAGPAPDETGDRFGTEVRVTALSAAPGGAPAAQPAPVPASAPAYVMFTSGSTGLPKGIEMPHRALVNLLRWQQDQSAALGSTARTLARSPLWFDVSFQEIFAALCFGGTVVVSGAGAERDPAALAALLVQQRVNRAFFPFVGLQQLVSDCVRRKVRLPDLKELVTSGEQLKLFPALTDFFRANTGCTLRNQYGPTETHVVTSFTLTGPPTRWPVLPPIGRPVDGAAVHILDQQLAPVPIGVTGELCIGGVPLATGYRGDAELTGQRFVPGPGGRLYRTGDLARRREDGEIEFLGRMDRQLKIRGHRVEPGEVEAALLRHHAVSEVAVVGREDGMGGTRLVAYLVPAGSYGPELDLRGHLAETLPEYAIPSVFALLDRLPVTPTGKIDTDALPEPVEARISATDRFTAPRTELEAALAEIWQRVLKVDQVGVFDHFLELGGDSIVATQAVAAANDRGLGITMQDFFAHPTIAEQAAMLPETPVHETERDDDERPAPLTPVQRWFASLNVPAADHWNIAVLLATDARLDRDLVVRTLAVLTRRHEVLGSSFRPPEATTGRLPADSRARVTEVAVPAGAGLDAAVIEQAQRAHRRIDLRHGPLVDATLLRGGDPGGDRLLLTIHHLVVDGVSWRVLLEEFQTVYRQLEAMEPVSLPVRSSSYQEWATGLVEYAGSESARAELDHWAAVPARPVPALPTGEPGLQSDARQVEFALSTPETDLLLRDLPGKYHARIEEILLSCLFEGVRSWTGHRSLLVEFEGHGRESVLPELDLTRTVGWFSTMYPVELRIADEGEVSPVGVLAAVKDAMRAVPNRGIGYGVLRYCSPDPAVRAELAEQAERSRPRIGFNYLGRFDALFDTTSMFRLAPEPTGTMVDPTATRPLPLYFQGQVVGGSAQFLLEYAAQSPAAADMPGVLRRFGEHLRSLIAARDVIGSDLLRASDFPEVGWSGSDFDTLLTQIEPGHQ